MAGTLGRGFYGELEDYAVSLNSPCRTLNSPSACRAQQERCTWRRANPPDAKRPRRAGCTSKPNRAFAKVGLEGLRRGGGEQLVAVTYWDPVSKVRRRNVVTASSLLSPRGETTRSASPQRSAADVAEILRTVGQRAGEAFSTGFRRLQERAGPQFGPQLRPGFPRGGAGGVSYDSYGDEYDSDYSDFEEEIYRY